MSERKHFPFLKMIAGTKVDLPDGWDYHISERVNYGTPAECFEVTGWVATERFKSGPRKGQINHAKKNRTHEYSIRFSDADRDAFLAAWEAETGICSYCHGNGDTLESWCSQNGATYRPCKKCNATGKAGETNAEAN